MRRRVGIVLPLLLGLLAASAVASAHAKGLATADLTVSPDGAVDAVVILAADDAWRIINPPLARTTTGDELVAARPSLRALFEGGVDVTADGARCAPRFADADLVAGDGVRLRGTFACGRAPETLGVTLRFVAKMGPGARVVTRVVAGAAERQALLGEGRLSLDMTLANPGAHSGTTTALVWPWLVLGVALAIGAWLALRLRGRRGSEDRT